MAIDFPNSPSVGDTYTTNGRTFRWNGTTWDTYTDAAAAVTHAGNHASGGSDPVAVAQSQVTGLTTALSGKVDSTDARLTDARTPTAHAVSHASAGSDAITIAQSQVTNLTTDLSAKAPLESPTFTGTVKTSSINNAAASAGGLAIDSSGVVTGGLPYPNRNLLYNGAMQVVQRVANSTGIVSTNYYTADRWLTSLSSLGTWTQSVESDGPTGSGLGKSFKMLCTTADASPAAGDLLIVSQLLEGQDLQHIAKGTSSAQQLTLSFWVKSNKTGTYIVRLLDADNNRAVSALYTVSVSAKWEKKSITFPADTVGALANDNGHSFTVNFWLGAGSTYTSGTLATSWVTPVDANQAAGQTNLAAATNNYWQVTGVQLEVGPVATPFEFKSFGQELRECQRYYIRTNGPIGRGISQSATASRATIQFPVAMRTAPSTFEISASDVYIGDDANYGLLVSSVAHNISSPLAANITANHASGATAQRAALLYTGGTGWLAVSAEL